MAAMNSTMGLCSIIDSGKLGEVEKSQTLLQRTKVGLDYCLLLRRVLILNLGKFAFGFFVLFGDELMKIKIKIF